MEPLPTLNAHSQKRPSDPCRVFISYAHADGKEFAENLYQELVEKHQISVWRDMVDLESGGKTWPSQIEDAIKNVEFLVLVLTPGAERSHNVLKEWTLARQEGVCVLPIIADRRLDLDRLPHWIKKQQLVDPSIPEQRNRFFARLTDRCTEPRVPFMLGKGLPEGFVERPFEFGKVIDLLLSADRQEPLAIIAALRSFGGYGKTALASAICRDDHIRNAFGDGILWVTLGDTIDEQGLVKKVNELISMLSDEHPSFSSIEPAETRLIELLADHDVLIVIDDVWHRANLDPFLKGGPNCARLITTRDKGLLPYGSKSVDVDAMRHEESLKLLGYDLQDAGLLTEALGALAHRLGHWPQLLSMVNGVLRGRVKDNESLVDALVSVNKDLAENGLTTFDESDEGRQRAVGITLNLSLQRLTEDQRTRFLELAIFPENVNIPLATVYKLWNQADPKYTETMADKLCGKLSNLSLLRNRDLGSKKSIRLQDVIQMYIVQQQLERLSIIHSQLLDAHLPNGQSSSADLGTWAAMPVTEEYLWDYLAFHLFESGRYHELRETVTNWPYLAKKIRVRNSLAINVDLRQALKGGLDEQLFARLQRVFAETEILSDDLTNSTVEEALFGRLQHLRAFLTEMPGDLTNRRSSYISLCFDFPDMSVQSSTDQAEEPQSSDSEPVRSCSYNAARGWIVSTSNEGLKLWDAQTGKLLPRHFENSLGDTQICAFNPDGTRVVFSSDRTLGLWEVDSDNLIVFPEEHSASINGCAFSPDGTRIVSASADHALILWNACDGHMIRRLERDSDWEWDDFLKREVETNVRIDGHEGSVNDCAFRAGGKSVVSASDDNTLKIWDIDSGAMRTLERHSYPMNRCAFSHDGQLVVASASEDPAFGVWSVETSSKVTDLRGHSEPVYGCSFSSDDKFIISASSDGTFRVWEVSSGECVATFYDKGEMYCCQMYGDMIVGGGTRGLYFLKLVR